jgi:hypothetical protein
MQVSWIEPDQLRDLVGQLQSPAKAGSNVAWELHTLPNPAGLGARELGIEESDLWLPDEQEPSAAAVAPEVAPPVAPAENFFAPAAKTEDHQEEETPIRQLPEQPKELWRIREKLRAIRERAIEAGLLAHVGVAKPARVEEPAPVVQREVPAPPAVQTPEPVPPPVSSPFSIAAEPAVAPAPVVTSGPVGATAEATKFEAPRGRISERLEAFASWASRQFGLHDLLIVDDHGDILWGIHEHAGLVVSAMMACKAAQRSSALGAAGLSTIIEQPISINRKLIVVPCETSYGALTIAFARQGAFPEADARLLGHALTIAIEADVGAGPAAPHNGTALD